MKLTKRLSSLFLAIIMLVGTMSGFSITAQASMASDAEDYEMGTTFNGSVGGWDTRYFKFYISEKSYVSIKGSFQNSNTCTINVYTINGKKVMKSSDFRFKYNNAWGWQSGSCGRYLNKGTYYLELASYRDINSNFSDTGNFNFRIQAEPQIKLGKTTITYLKSKSKKKLTVKYKAQKDAIGYKITYSTDERFRKNVKTTRTAETSKTIGGLKKGKRYYVKVCAYTVYDDGTYVYGQNSKPKTVKVKK